MKNWFVHIMKPNNIYFNCMENKTKTFFKITPFWSMEESHSGHTAFPFLGELSLFSYFVTQFCLVWLHKMWCYFFQILWKKTLNSLMKVTVQHVQIFFMSLSSVAPLSMCFSFPLQPQRLHLSSESLSGDKASTSPPLSTPSLFLSHSPSLSSFQYSLHPYVQPSQALNEMNAEPVL